MDEVENPMLVKVAVAFGCLFFAACIQSCTDLQYRARGQKGTGTVSKIVEQRGKYGTVSYEVYYNFANLNRQGRKSVRGTDFVSAAEVGSYFEGQQVPVEYYGDEMFQSRIAGRSSRWAPWFLLGSFLGLVGTVVGLTIAARLKKAPTRKPALKPARR
jgi:hypothetical protein